MDTMMRRSLVVLLSLSLLVVLGACEENPVGRICDLGEAIPGSEESVVASPSLDCQTRTCLKVPLTRSPLPENSRYPEGNLGLCTGECSSDEECDRVPESPCQTGFTCAVPTVVGPFCCKKLCVCRDYIVIPDGGLDEPAACDPGNPDNRCCNLTDRAGNPDYEECP